MKKQVKLTWITLILAMSVQVAASAQSAFSAGYPQASNQNNFAQQNGHYTQVTGYPIAGNFNQSNGAVGNYSQANSNPVGGNYSQPAGSGNYLQQAANYSQPSSNYSQPSINYSQPSSNYSQPSSNYSQPSSNYSQPSSNYSQPSSNYSQPSSNYAGSANYSQPGSNYAGSANYSQPSNNYAGSANYSQPSSNYAGSQAMNYPVAGNYTRANNFPPPNYVATNFSAPGYGMPPHGNLMQPNVFPNFMNPVQVNNAAISAYNTGVKLLNQKCFDDSIKYFHETLRINPNFAHAHRALGLAYKGLYDYPTSLSEFRTELKMNPGDADSYYFAGHVALFQHNYSLANDLYAHYLSMKSSGHEADSARTALEIMDKNYFHPTQDDYLAAATTPDLHRWQAAGSRPLKVYIADCSGVRGYKPEYLPILQNAFSEWANSTRIVQFEFTNNINEADITCAWVDERAKGSIEAGLTHRSTKASGEISHAHIDLYTFPDAKDAPGNLLTCARKVDLHEIGHALGLDHSNSIYDIMSPVAFPDGLDFPLSRRDINTMVAVYAAPAAAAATNLTQIQSASMNSYSTVRE